MKIESNKCPYCDNEDALEAVSLENQEETVIAYMRCPSCGKEYKDIFDFAGQDVEMEEKGRKFWQYYDNTYLKK